MKVKTAFICAHILCLAYGLLCGGFTRFAASFFGIELGEAGMFITRIFGAALLGFTAIFLYARNEPHSPARQSIIIGEWIHSTIAVIFWIDALIRGIGDMLIIIPLLSHLVLAIWFGYYAIKCGVKPVSFSKS